MNFSGSVNLNEFPDLSKATNLEHLELNYCHSLVTVPSTIENLNKLVKLEMKGCNRLEVLPINVNLSSLETLDLSWCSSLSSFPQISRSIKKLYLNNTAIEQVPCCIKNFFSLYELTMCCCKRLKNISPNIFRLSRLVKADFSDCGEIKTALGDAIVEATMSLEDRFPSIRLDTKAYRRNHFEFNNCSKLDADALAVILQSYVGSTVLPGEEVPTYFTHQASGNYITVNLTRSILFETPLIIKACVVVGKGFHSYFGVRWHFREEGYWDTILEDQLGFCEGAHLVLLSFKFWPTDRLFMSLFNSDNKAIEFEFSTINPCSATFSPSVQSIQQCGIRVLKLSHRRHQTELNFNNDVETEYLFNLRIKIDAGYHSNV